MYEINHEMMNYDFVEGTEFEGLMPKAIDANGGVGTNDEQPTVKFMGGHRGHDQLQVVDVEKFFEEQASGSSGEGGDQGGQTEEPTDEPANP